MKAYFLKTNASNIVVITDGKTAKVFDAAPSGIYEGIDLHSEDAAELLKNRFSQLSADGELNSYEDMYSPNEVDYEDIKEELEDAELVFDDSKKLYKDLGGECQYYIIMEEDGSFTAHGFEPYGEGWKHYEKNITVTEEDVKKAADSYGPEGADFLAAMDDLQSWPPEPEFLTDEEKEELASTF